MLLKYLPSQVSIEVGQGEKLLYLAKIIDINTWLNTSAIVV